MAWRFAPDVDPTTPQIYTAMARMLATPWGTYRSSPSQVQANSSAHGGSSLNSVVLVKTDGSTRWFSGTAASIFESTASDTTWTDRRSAAYAATAWQFAQYGDVSIAVDLATNPQASTAGNFAALAGTPPKAKLICTQSLAVMLANYDDGVNQYKDGWWASDIGSHTTWVPAVANQAANGRLLQTPGAITAIIAFGGGVIAFKDSSVYMGRYVGRPTIWQWQLIHPTVGCSSPDGCTTDGRTLFFYGQAGAYIFDGQSFKRVDDGIYKYLSTNVTAATCNVGYSATERIFTISIGTSFPFINYCPDSNLWGQGDAQDAAISGTLLCFVKTPPNLARRMMVTNAGPSSVGHALTGTTYVTNKSMLKTGWIGDDQIMTFLAGLVPQFVPDGDYTYDNGATQGQLTHKSSKTRGAAMVLVGNYTINTTEGRYNFTHSNRWHEFTLQDGSAAPFFSGMEIAGLLPVPGKASGQK